MRIFAAILSVYFLALIIMPCVDVPIDNNMHKIELTGQTSQSPPGDADHCTPFCPCDCCVTPIIQVESSIQLNCLDYTFQEYSEYSTSYKSTLFAIIWQPPKLS